MNDRKSLYKTKVWQRLRYYQLKHNPLCVMCSQLGMTTAADIVDHITPHKGDMILFSDENNLQSLCKACHDRHKQKQEKSGVLIGCDTSGYPVDANHHWNK